MTFQQELTSWLSPEAKQANEAPVIGSRALSSERLAVPGGDGKQVVVTFLRHCGCPCAYSHTPLCLSFKTASSTG